MGRKPVDQIAKATKPQGRPGIWTEIRAQREFTIGDITAATDINRRTVDSYLKCLVAAGILSVDKTDRVKHFQLIKDVGVEAPRVSKSGERVTQGDGNERLWRAMKILKTFTALDLAIHASLPERSVSVETAKTYCLWLYRAGIICARKHGSPGVPTVYQFTRDVGPLPPQVQRINQVFDPNSAKVLYPRPDDAGAQS